ncbi:MAG TPA: SDR family oxidoreductase [Mycobacteriales bacterium]|nr:SDR family oxidoreductase [Mycobacteriales bacterium]
MVRIDAADAANDLEQTLAAAAPNGLAAVVDAVPLRSPPESVELVAFDGEAWRREAEDPLRRALHVLQGAYAGLRGTGGRIVVLLPSAVTTGAPGAVASIAAAEGYRSLAKAAARTWGRDGVTVNCLLVAADADLSRPGLQPPALGRPSALRSDVTSVIATLLSPGFAAVTGATIAVDGGVWMTP